MLHWNAFKIGSLIKLCKEILIVKTNVLNMNFFSLNLLALNFIRMQINWVVHKLVWKSLFFASHQTFYYYDLVSKNGH